MESVSVPNQCVAGCCLSVNSYVSMDVCPKCNYVPIGDIYVPLNDSIRIE